MSGAQRDQSALNVVSVGIADNSDFTSEVETVIVDLHTYEVEHLALLVNAALAIGTPTADDTVTATFAIKHCDTSGGTYTTAQTKTVTILGTPAESASDNVAAICPLNCGGLKRYVKIGVTFAMGAGATGSLTSADGSALLQQYPSNGQPEADYSAAGYFKE